MAWPFLRWLLDFGPGHHRGPSFSVEGQGREVDDSYLRIRRLQLTTPQDRVGSQGDIEHYQKGQNRICMGSTRGERTSMTSKLSTKESYKNKFIFKSTKGAVRLRHARRVAACMEG